MWTAATEWLHTPDCIQRKHSRSHLCRKIKNLTKRLQIKKSLTGDHLRTAKRLELEIQFSRKQKTRPRRIWEKQKNITKDCIMQSSNCEKEGEMMWINNGTWDSAISWQNRDSVVFGCISKSHEIDYIPALNFLPIAWQDIIKICMQFWHA